MLEYRIEADRIDQSGSVARRGNAVVALDTSLAGRADACNPAELLLASLAACMLKGVERAAPILGFEFRGASVRLHAVREDAPPRIVSIDYDLVVDTDEPDRRLDLLHRNVLKYGTISNTLGRAVTITGRCVRGPG
jgi:uncharacterized OsmC-like protein